MYYWFALILCLLGFVALLKELESLSKVGFKKKITWPLSIFLIISYAIIQGGLLKSIILGKRLDGGLMTIFIIVYFIVFLIVQLLKYAYFTVMNELYNKEDQKNENKRD